VELEELEGNLVGEGGNRVGLKENLKEAF